RAPKLPDARNLFNRVVEVARGAALMTGTKAIIPPISGLSNIVPNTILNQLMYKQFQAYGPPIFDKKEKQFARELQATLSPEDIQNDVEGFKELTDKGMSDIIVPFEETDDCIPGSTDVGDVSWVVPTTQCRTATWVLGTPAHTWQVVALGK